MLGTYHMSNDIQKTLISQNPVNDSAKIFDFEQLLHSVVRIKSEDKEGVGFIISKEGHIITNAHILDGNLFCFGFMNQESTPIKYHLIDFDDSEQLDVCILKPEMKRKFTPLEFSSENLKVGQTVFTIGNPRNLGMSLSKGFVSQIKPDHIQLDITLNPGNSGGPVFDEKGYVVGMISYLIKDVNGLGFAVSLKGIHDYIYRLSLSHEKIFLADHTLSNHLIVDEHFIHRFSESKKRIIKLIKKPLYQFLLVIVIFVLMTQIIVLAFTKTMTITYQGAVISQEKIFVGSSIIDDLPTLHEDGKVFDGWYIDQALTNRFDSDSMPFKNITLYPKFSDLNIETNIHLETNGGILPASFSLGELDLLNLPIPTKEGYIFTNWYLDHDLTTEISSDISHGDITLYAGWILDAYQFTEYLEYIKIDLYTGNESIIDIPSIINLKPVTEIGDDAFRNITALNIKIPDSIITIGSFAFANIEQLEKIDISFSSNLTMIGRYGFHFNKNSNVKTLFIPSKVEIMGENVNYSPNFESYVVDEGNAYFKSIDGVLYSKDTTKLINYPSGKKNISFEVIETVESFGPYPFHYNNNLEELTFHPLSQVKVIPQLFFDGTHNLRVFHLPPLLRSIDPYFANYQGFHQLEEIHISDLNLYFMTNDNVLYDKSMETIYLAATSLTGTFIIPDQVKSIKSYAFTNSHITDVIIPSSMIDISYEAFKGAGNMLNFYVDDENLAYTDVDGVLMSKDLSILVAYPAARMGTYVVPKEVKTIGEAAFFVTNLSVVKFEQDSLIFSIGYHAFTSASLEEVYIPKTVMIISTLAFAMHPGMTIYVEHEVQPSGWREDWATSSNTIIWGFEHIYA